MSKYVEFMDTVRTISLSSAVNYGWICEGTDLCGDVQVIMIMKRSMRQISVLHVYHHSSISLIWWAIVHHAPGGEGTHLDPGIESFDYDNGQ